MITIILNHHNNYAEVDILICIAAITIIVVSGWGIKICLREQDPRWQMAKEIYRVRTALQQVAKLESISEVRPLVITGPNGISINYMIIHWNSISISKRKRL